MTTSIAHRGLTNFQAGLSAEAQIERAYADAGYRVLERRWRGSQGEIDLVMKNDALISFVEVKKARDLAQAAARVSVAQQRRIMRTAEEFLSARPDGLDSDCRFDVGLVSMTGGYEIIENAFSAHG